MAIYAGKIVVKTTSGTVIPLYPAVYADNIPDLSSVIASIIKAPSQKTLAEFISENPILSDGQLGIVTDYDNRFKIGDGTTDWLSLGYIR